MPATITPPATDTATASPTSTPPACTTADPVPWPIEVRALVRDGYQCRKCHTAVVADDERRVVWIRLAEPATVENTATLCVQCAREHEERLALSNPVGWQRK